MRAVPSLSCLQVVGPIATLTPTHTHVVKAGDAYVLMETEEYTGAVAQHRISSTLVLVGHCVGFGSPGHEVLAVFPPGTKVIGSSDSC